MTPKTVFLLIHFIFIILVFMGNEIFFFDPVDFSSSLKWKTFFTYLT